jgi:hypothetical protein
MVANQSKGDIEDTNDGEMCTRQKDHSRNVYSVLHKMSLSRISLVSMAEKSFRNRLGM